MKKICLALLIALLAFQLFACDMDIYKETGGSEPTETTEGTTDSTPTTKPTESNPDGTNSTESTGTASTNPAPTTSTTSTTPKPTEPAPTTSKPTEPAPTIPAPTEPDNGLQFTTQAFPNSLKKDGPLTAEGLPSVGNPKLLVIPVNLDDSKKTNDLLEDIEIAFSGTEKETGWESVESYYYESSYHQLNLDCDVMDEWFTPSKSASYYENYYDSKNDVDGSILILREALEYYEDKLDLTDYDYDKDGYIDSVWLVYNYDVDYYDDESIYWAFVSWEYEEYTYDGLMACNYAFGGTDFMYEESDMYDTDDIHVDAHTFIHETGHLMGLDDYYDYDTETGPSGGTYSADMMDGNIGDHGVISKMLLGWVKPTIVTGTGEGTYSLSSFATTGKFLLISDHEVTSVYDEYFLVEFYTNDGLNAHDQPILDDDYIVAEGIRVMHVDARLNYNKHGQIEWNEGDSYVTGFLYDNSDTDKLFLDNLRADYGSRMEEYLWPESLYREGEEIFGKDVWKNHKYHSGSKLNFTLEVLGIKNDLCEIKLVVS